ncbi:protein kinase domain-containing protein [Ktedonospora formicarum]|uniref:non-specific serine/threonine protein kinase n=1 Tax=Ktedonospora formicarum TaxID=2778364 RepID=A0A8J3I8L6_9CHLR|nr:protein kinase [Ktedonospora formicarum]GHO49456.1 hypothetical protein KSX_76190 [Ktedonospora formicarum]
MTKYIDLSGQQLGAYRLVRWLGGGQSGDVYLGEHTLEHTQAALKVFNVYLTREEDQKAFIDEVHAQQLENPSIMQLLDGGVGSNHLPFVIMEYASNGSLRGRHTKGLQMPLADVLAQIAPIAEALQYAHEQGIIHGNVKPENMLVDAEDKILLSDFTLSTLSHAASESDTQDDTTQDIGPYAAPELQLGEVSPASDQYALGAVVYQWLSGRLPSQVETEGEDTREEIAPPSLRTFAPHIPTEVEQVLQRALAHDPEQRFASVQEFAKALETASDPERGLVVLPLTRTLTTKVLNPADLGLDFDEENEPQAPTAETIQTVESFASEYASSANTLDETQNELDEVSNTPAVHIDNDQYALATLPANTSAKQTSKGNSRGRFVALVAVALVLLVIGASAFMPPLRNNALSITSLPEEIQKSLAEGNNATNARNFAGNQSNNDSSNAPGKTATPGVNDHQNTNNTNGTSTSTNGTSTGATPTQPGTKGSTPTTPPKATPTPVPTAKPTSKPAPTPTPKPIVAAVDGKNPTTYVVSGKTCEQSLSNSHSKHVTISGVGATIYFRFSVTCHAAWAKIVFDKAMPSGKYGNAKIVRINDGKAYTCDTGGNKYVAPGQTSCYTGMVQDNASQTASAYGSYMSTYSSQLGPY